MARKSHNHRFDLPPLELECLKALWARGRGTVREVRERLYPERPLAYTTIMTVMGRLARKGLVEREKRGRAHLYRPAVTEAAVRDFALDRLLANFFRGSREGLRRHLENGRSAETLAAQTETPRPGTSKAKPAPAEAEIDTSLL